MIQMICGAYGACDGLKRACDGPFSLSPAEEERLVKRGVAEYVREAPAVPPADPPVASAENSDTESDTLDIDGGHFTKESLMTMSRSDMEKLAADLGINAGKCKNKSEIADLIAAIEIQTEADAEDFPVTNIEEPMA